jgi:serine/threonine-protein kinase
MAEVWEGHDATLRRAVAVKILLTHLAADSSFVERFRREAVTSARVAHPCVVATYDAGVDAGTAYIVMELVQGQTLRQLLTASAPLDPGLAVAIALQIADALANAHRAGLVHRDIKPGNILLCDDGGGALRVKVTDFGIAKVGADLGADLTQTGTVLGTPKYLSPEQVEGRVDPDARSDLYALGVVLFEMLTGRPPFNGATEMATALSHLRDEAPRVAVLRPGISAGLDSFVAGLLSKSPSDRPPTAVAARQALDVLAREGPGARPGPPGRRPFPDGAVPRNGAAPRNGAVPRDGSSPRNDPVPRNGTVPRNDAVPRNGSSPRPSAPRPPALSAPVGNGTWDRQRWSDAPAAASGGPATTSGPAPPPRPWPVGPRPAGPQPVGPQPGDPTTRTPTPSSLRRAAPDVPAPRPIRRHRSGRVPGMLVALLVLVAVIVAGILIADHDGAGRGATTGDGAGSGSVAALPIQAVTVWMDASAKGHTADNPSETPNVFDGNPATVWETDPYHGRFASDFGGYYDGEGLAIRLTASHTLARLVVSSASRGWSASAYVSADEPAYQAPLGRWGAPTDSVSDVRTATTTFRLGGRRGQWVLFWLTDLGPGDQVSIGEVAVH